VIAAKPGFPCASLVEFLPDLPGKLDRVLRVTNFRRRKNGGHFFCR
tara:strand:- start:15070 stop:15207 length:138 start_codon:yes stop_codon:yes gene_type:complete